MPYRTLLLLAACAFAGTAGAKEIKLKNPGFEEPATEHDVISGWRTSQHSGEDSYEFTTVGDIYFKGKRSFRLTRIREQIYGSLDQSLPATGMLGRKIEYRFQMRAENVGPGGFFPYVNLTGRSGDLIDQIRGEVVTGTVDKWTTVKVTLTVPDYVHHVVLGMLLMDSGTVWADEASLRIVDDAEAKPGAKPTKPREPRIMIP